jgi:hypothetical protein
MQFAPNERFFGKITKYCDGILGIYHITKKECLNVIDAINKFSCNLLSLNSLIIDFDKLHILNAQCFYENILNGMYNCILYSRPIYVKYKNNIDFNDNYVEYININILEFECNYILCSDLQAINIINWPCIDNDPKINNISNIEEIYAHVYDEWLKQAGIDFLHSTIKSILKSKIFQ